MIRGVSYDAEVEYLESTGTQWIDTEVLPAGATILIDCVVSADFSTTQVIVGCGGGGGNWFGNVNGYFGVSTNATCGPSSVRSLIRVEYLSGRIQATKIATGEMCQVTTGTLASRNIGLFATAVPSYFAKIRMFSARILVSGTLVRDFIPVRVGSVGYMYDRVSGRLFGNAGTGSFVVGPDVARPIMGLHFMRPRYTANDYVQDGLVAMWDGIENAGWGVHDPNATTWKDLIGSCNLTLYSSMCAPADNALVCTKSTAAQDGAYTIAQIPAYTTAEAVFRVDEASGTYKEYAVFCDRNKGIFGNNWKYQIFTCSRPRVYVSAEGLMAQGAVVALSWDTSARIATYNGGTAKNSTTYAAVFPTSNRFSVCGCTSASLSFHGAIHSIRLYSRALTADEIAHNYAVDKARFNLPEVTA